MADKEATVYIITLGQAMADCSNGRTESDLDWSMRYVWNKISTTLAANRKTWTVGVVGLGTDESDNDQARSGLEGYENISVLQQIGPMNMAALHTLQNEIKPSGTNGGDAVSAIVTALMMIQKYCKKLKYNRKIVLVTDGREPIDADAVEEVSQKINEEGVELTVIGVDFDDADYGFKEENKRNQKRLNERLLKKLCDRCDRGLLGTMVEAIEDTEAPRAKQIRPYKNYDGVLTLGDPEKYDSAAVFPVERYTKTKVAIPMSASSVVVKPGHAGTSHAEDEDEDVQMGGTEFGDVKHQRQYSVKDASEPGGKKHVKFEDLAKGYLYGDTAVHISESDWNVTKLDTKKEFTILGFIPFSSFRPFMSMGEANLIKAQKDNDEAEVALSSFINALYELESYAVARFVEKDGKEPKLLLLMPSPKLDGEFECLYDLPLPFAEDVRQYQFPPLDKVLTVTGTVLKKHRLLPNDNLNQAMSDYVDAMDLSADSQPDGEEYAAIEETYNPMIHRLDRAVRRRAVHPDEPLGQPDEVLLQYSRPPTELVENAKRQIDALVEASDVKKVPPKAQGGKFGKKETVKPRSGLDIDALFSTLPTRTKLSSENAIPDYKQILSKATDDSAIEDVTKQLGVLIRSDITNSYGGNKDGQAQEKLRVMREELLGLDMPALYNTFISSLKKSILSGELNGDRREMWWRIREGRLGLITVLENELSEVAPEEAQAFWK
ncbi:SPOC domain-like protein [Thozetella sp. PMI_491]|nr:SPOC domain-like protein [Thozetella sp. PMI_491]